MRRRTPSRHRLVPTRSFLRRLSRTSISGQRSRRGSGRGSRRAPRRVLSRVFRRPAVLWAKRPRMLRGIRGFLAACLAFCLVLIGAVVVTYIRTPLPTEPQDGVTDEGSAVYYADGRTPAFRLGANREVVRHEQIPEHVRWAVIAAEDRGFYSGHGVSPMGMARALVKGASGGETQGGSTITQQLARNYFKGLSQKRSFDRKFKEIFVALKLDEHRSKKEILTLYLNTVFFGRQTSGIQAAARAYFDKDVWQLTVAEGALLAAMIQRPMYFHTQGDTPPARALRARWQYVINGMVTLGKLSRAQADRERFPQTRDEWRGVDVSGQTLLVRQRVLDELRELDVPIQSVVNGKLKIYTSLDQRWMRYAEQAMKAAGEPRWPGTVRAGLIAVDPRDGAVKAFYGGDPKRSQYDSVFNPVAQAGSTFKPYVLAAALRRGYSARSIVNGRSPQKFAPDGQLTPMTAPGYLVENDEKIGSLGPVDLVEATAQSVNTGYVKLGFEAGLDNVARTATDLGVPAAALAPFKNQAGITLGTATIPAADQAAGYAAFANGGLAVRPHVITKIVDAWGREIPLPWRRPGRRVLTTEQAAQVTYSLRQTVQKGTGRRAALTDHEAAGKTGTTDRNRAAWFVGFIPQLSTAVMMTDTKGAPLKGLYKQRGTVSGETTPAMIWRAFMAKAGRDLTFEPHAEPAFTGQVRNWAQPSPDNPAELAQWCSLPANRKAPACLKAQVGRGTSPLGSATTPPRGATRPSARPTPTRVDTRLRNG
ncbi:transglycosylase domain-containing protein [Actinomadura rudentiformis]|uniref:Penicillin-binding protein n=1 Tax=Actinomadura rudentiformis TaxID=359158 RepID=A0A6H9YY82_9ACTN|nr:transglycosylase domain-containing protein [Actinomadura rudentiformis]KAB2351483.1 penicillin-binding protein [Actinomadura rudentiformis]